MSEWTEIKGSCNSKKVSMKKILKNVFKYEDAAVISYVHNKFEGRIERDGFHAAKTIQEIIDRAKDFDPKAKIAIEANILFY